MSSAVQKQDFLYPSPALRTEKSEEHGAARIPKKPQTKRYAHASKALKRKYSAALRELAKV